MSAADIIWRPNPEAAARTRIARFMRERGLATLEELQRRSVEDLAWYWGEVARDLGWTWSTPYQQVVDLSRGIPWPRWFPGGRMNLAANCVDRHLARRGAEPAIVSEAESGDVRTLSYAELGAEVAKLANALRRLGVGAGDTVGIFLPMSQEAAIAVLACSRIGAVYAPCFSGYGAQAVATRLSGCEAKALITADAFSRRGNPIPMKRTADEAVADCPSVRHVIVHRRTGAPVTWREGRDVWWHEATAGERSACDAVAVEADHPALIIYTSGTTGQPKGTVLTQGGFGIKNAHDWAYVFDMGEGARMFWITDLGWLMGPMLITGTLLMGGTVVLFEGTPDYPKPDRIWQLCARHRVTHLGISPTAVRALMPYGTDWVAPHDLSAIRIIGSTGEPWNPEPYRWLFEHVGKSRVPIINYTGGTEISGGILSSFPISPIKPCSFNGPIPGMAADCYGEDGRPVRGEVGELVVTRPWPGMTAGFWKDPDRYLDTYWSRWPDVWIHGDWAYVDEDGYWFIHGRSDDTLKIAGKRVGPAEIESVLVGHPAVNEAAAIGVPHEIKGEAVVCFAVLRPGFEPTEVLRGQLQEHVTQAMGKAIRPDRVLFARELPKTRSAKIMRRVIRATYLGKEPGDLSSLDNASAISAVKEAG
ncbi:MAG: AMP-dependent synthetase [Candidatus Rokuibacteriota bacterium]|nr:MAG: AMP-dependent synthetase [Candidatus Rokubacteria bacterium]